VTIATSDRWKDKASGEMREATEWHRVVFFGRLAEIAGEYLKKGRPVYVEGKLRTRKWTDKDGNERYTTEIVADVMQMLGSREGAGGADFDEAAGGRRRAPGRARRRRPRTGEAGAEHRRHGRRHPLLGMLARRAV